MAHDKRIPFKVAWLAAILLLAGCSPAATIASPTVPPGADATTPGQVQVIVFADTNHNGVQDAGEIGVHDTVGIVAGACNGSKMPDWKDTLQDGTLTINNLAPGDYCVSYGGNRAVFSKGAIPVTVSPGKTVSVQFAISPEP